MKKGRNQTTSDAFKIVSYVQTLYNVQITIQKTLALININAIHWPIRSSVLGSFEAVVCTCRLATFFLNAAARSSMRMHVHAACVMCLIIANVGGENKVFSPMCFRIIS